MLLYNAKNFIYKRGLSIQICLRVCQTLSWHTYLLLACVVAAAVGASGIVVGRWVRWVCDLQPQSAIHVLLYERINHKTGKRVNRDDRLDKVQSLHCVEDVCCKAKRNKDNYNGITMTKLIVARHNWLNWLTINLLKTYIMTAQIKLSTVNTVDSHQSTVYLRTKQTDLYFHYKENATEVPLFCWDSFASVVAVIKSALCFVYETWQIAIHYETPVSCPWDSDWSVDF